MRKDNKTLQGSEATYSGSEKLWLANILDENFTSREPSGAQERANELRSALQQKCANKPVEGGNGAASSAEKHVADQEVDAAPSYEKDVNEKVKAEDIASDVKNKEYKEKRRTRTSVQDSHRGNTM